VPSSSDATTTGLVRDAIDVRRFPWIRPLVGAYLHDFGSVAGLFAGNPADPSAWQQTIGRVQRSPRDRARLSAIVDAQLARRGSAPEAKQSAARLKEPSAVAVVTGQQAGVFGGPLYTLLKAISAIQLARQIEQAQSVPVVPVFWIEADDHDWAEVKSADLLDADLQVRQVSLDDPDGAGTRPVASIALDARVDAAITALESALPPTEFTPQVLAKLRLCYRAGATLSTALGCWLDELLGKHGLVVFEASDPAAKPLAADLFVHELSHSADTASLVRAATDKMRQLGHAPQVEATDDGTTLMYVDGEGRRPIKRRDGGYAIGGASRTAAELSAEAKAHPERFSPGVLLRPIVQDRLFPTIAYVGGPSEIAYQAELLDVYRAFGVEPPLLVSRGSATLLDSAAMRFLEKSGSPLESLQAQDDTALNALLERQLPPGLGQALEEIDRDVSARIAGLKEAVSGVDPTLAGTVDTTADKMRESLKTLHNKIIQASKRKDETLRRQFQRTRALTFPGGKPQERALSLTYFINRYGFGLVDRLIDELPLDASKHYVLVP